MMAALPYDAAGVFILVAVWAAQPVLKASRKRFLARKERENAELVEIDAYFAKVKETAVDTPMLEVVKPRERRVRHESVPPVPLGVSRVSTDQSAYNRYVLGMMPG